MLKIIRGLWTIIRTILTFALILLLAVVISQRVSDNKVAVAGIRIFNVATGSMVPVYNVGDTVLTIAQDPSKLKVGDDVTYLGTEGTFKDRIVTHRIISIQRGEDGIYIFQTQGTANDVPDPKINQTQIYGKVVYKIKSISYINGIIGNLYGMYFAIFVPIGIIMFIEFIGYKKDKDNDKEDDEEDDKKIEENDEETKENKEIEKRKKRREKRRRKIRKEK